MNTLRFTCLLALAAPLLCLAQQKPSYPDAEAGKHVGEEATVTGKVVAVSKSGKGTTFLNFGDRFPRHTFGGVVFARDEAVVGDVKQYEGKDMALTGRIEASPDGKPQIVIKTADQLKLAGAAMPSSSPAPPATPPMPSPSTSAPPSPPAPAAATPATPSPKPAAKIALASNWNSAGAGGEMTRKDLAKIFAAYGSASTSTEAAAPAEVYPGVPFLAPLALAKKRLNLEGATSAKTRVACPGLPQGSFTAHAFSGVFIGGFNRLFLVTDNADQVVSVLAVEESTRSRTPNATDTTGYHTYNFIIHRAKGTDDLVIRHEIATDGAPAGVVVVDSMLVDPTDPENPPPVRSTRSTSSRSTSSSKPKTGKVLERSRWFVPVPVVNLILDCVGR